MKRIIKIISIPLGIIILYLGLIVINQFTYILGATTGMKIEKANRPYSVLLVIDIQKSLPETMPDKDAFLKTTNKAIDHWRSRGKEAVFIAQVKEEKSLRSVFLPHIAARSSEAAELHDALHKENPLIFTKLQADAFSNPEFEAYLAANRIGKLYITGMAAEVCVDYTIKGALNRGYQVYVIRDAILALFGKESLEKMLQKYEDSGGKVITLDEFLRVEE